MPLKFILVPMGSAGDVLPLVWLGKTLRARGHDVVCVAQDFVADMPRRAGIRTVPWGNRADQEAIVRNPDIWHPRKAIDVVMQFAGKWAADCMDAIEPEIEPGRTVLIAGALAFGARALAEKRSIPLLSIHLQPTVFMSAEDSPVPMAKGEWIARLPRPLRRAFFALAHRKIDRTLGPVLGKMRFEARIAPDARPMKGVMRDYWHSPDGVLCLFPEWFAKKAADWPRQTLLLGFPQYDESDTRPLSPELLRFLERCRHAGRLPVVITPGSANAHAANFLREAAGACRMLNCPAIIVTRFLEQAPAPDAAGDLFAADHAPFSLLFPHAGAVIHHGGIGTTSQCLAAGVPQLIMPLSHDQPDNAARIKRLGVGDYRYPSAFRAGKIAPLLQSLMQSQTVAAACRSLRDKCRSQMSESELAELLESLGDKAFRRVASAAAGSAPSAISALTR